MINIPGTFDVRSLTKSDASQQAALNPSIPSSQNAALGAKHPIGQGA
jgi:hypothetical protein